ncbi:MULTISPECIES: PadR family transcriptional regulator [unclassified Haladaptatus]|uniref:PadR family transcriptional regulator n=1 Tax=unclassified Haladaptatus TaxID=2622732 RepID=UPI00209BD975|nr:MULTISPECIES: PadR family transcriptional regulator [unclassified Haladaptatus]MCO8247088.1 PadR family transcriptional regulator [Haladaptatus sp. AB643]MCO8256645.1 PadR family transcriptional regulator [Haladaptatus sp. AB618]
MSEAETVSNVATARDLTAFQQNVLIVLAEESRYGLAIKRELEDFYDEEVNHGRLYPNLDTLIERGLVEKSELDKRTNEYAITDEGIEVLLDSFEWRFKKFITNDERAEKVKSLLEAAQ